MFVYGKEFNNVNFLKMCVVLGLSYRYRKYWQSSDLAFLNLTRCHKNGTYPYVHFYFNISLCSHDYCVTPHCSPLELFVFYPNKAGKVPLFRIFSGTMVRATARAQRVIHRHRNQLFAIAIRSEVVISKCRLLLDATQIGLHT